jgi:hypothetical protein
VRFGRLVLACGGDQGDELILALGEDRHGSSDLPGGHGGTPLGASGELLGGRAVEHGFNTAVLPGNVVRIRGRETRHCFALAREVIAVVAHDRPAFTWRATITRDDDDRAYGRHLGGADGAEGIRLVALVIENDGNF